MNRYNVIPSQRVMYEKVIFSCSSQGHYLLLVISVSIYIFNAILRSSDTLRGHGVSGQGRERTERESLTLCATAVKTKTE